ncbi:DUF3618 domain-containing protein [Pseudonocardia humida]|uniref:DUF3618 domain-containing protein n=1 Tax=Pseudonocardia humida TaxID=2800819 RepID=A0ABT1ABP3_9PSEU|nr:DUF3618 domain-containing protein [Pseudonocardia humida]MCO1660413.1 DUF3618 domain-containing protein [Pseudonocardia humida]
MSTQGSDRGTGRGRGDVVPLDPQRPYVDGSAATPEQLRAEVGRLTEEHVERVEEARDDLAATLAELSTRLDPRPRVQELGQRAVAAVTRPAVLGSAGALAALVVLRRRRRARATDQLG